MPVGLVLGGTCPALQPLDGSAAFPTESAIAATIATRQAPMMRNLLKRVPLSPVRRGRRDVSLAR
jgi:hypothetical protein